MLDLNIMDNIEISQPEEIDIANEIAHLEAMYKHYKILYRKIEEASDKRG